MSVDVCTRKTREQGQEAQRIQRGPVQDVLGRTICGGVVSDGPDTTPYSLPDHDLVCCRRSVGGNVLVRIEEHVEGDVGLGADSLESVDVGRGRVLIGGVYSP